MASKAAAERAELLARAVADFEVFSRALVTIATKSGARSNLVWNPIQRLYCQRRTRRDLVLKARQVGFSTLELARDVWRFLQPGQRVLVVCQTDKDSTYRRKFTDDVNRIFDGLQYAGLALNFGTNSAGAWSLPGRDSFLQITEAGASEAAASKKGRGGTFTRLHSTEAAFYEYPEKALNAALEGVPDLPGTEIVFESTPNGAGTWFHNQWRAAVDGTSGYTPHFFAWHHDPTYQVPLAPGERVEPETERERELVSVVGISLAQLKWYRRKVLEKGQDLTDQEYPSDPERCFLVSGRTFFDKVSTDRLVPQTRDPLRVEEHGALRIWADPVPGRAYVVTADPSEGVGGDPGAALVHERATGKHVATLHGQFAPWEMGRLLAAIGTKYNNALIVVERNNHGHAVLQALEHGHAYRNVYVADDERPGWHSNEVTRSAALDALEASHRSGEWTTPDARVVGEMRTFVISASGKAQAGRGAHDDLVMAAAIAHDVLRKPVGSVRPPPQRPPVYRLGTGRGF